MNSYEEKQARRRDRLAAAAQRARERSNERINRAHSMASAIPFGQPILVGHHSEGRDRRFRARIDDGFRKGFALQDRAEELERRAEAVGNGGISSDDPEAIAKLQTQLSEAEALQARMKAANKLVRKRDRAGLATLGFTEKQIDNLLTPDFAGRLGFPDYRITNNGANIRRLKQRIADLEKRAAAPAREPIAGDGWTISEDVEDNRVVIRFDVKPSAEMLGKLRSCGFKWSPTRRAHVRMRNAGAWYDATRLLGDGRR